MKKYLKENIKNLPFILIAFIMFYSITTLATNYLFNSNEVSYDNSETGLHADEVQGAIDEVFQHATDYSELKTKIGTSTLTTTAQTLIGGVNELKTSVTSLNDQIGSLSSISVATDNSNSNYWYRIVKIGKIVRLQYTRKTAATDGTIVFTVPSGYRPKANTPIKVLGFHGSDKKCFYDDVTIYTSGAVQFTGMVSGETAYFSVDCLYECP